MQTLTISGANDLVGEHSKRRYFNAGAVGAR
jgi:hypothetical protein